MTAIRGPGYLTVVRGLENGSELAEMWVISSTQTIPDVEPNVRLYVGRFNQLTNLNTVPPSANGKYTCKNDGTVGWSDVPDEVKEEFQGQVQGFTEAFNMSGESEK